MSDFQVDIDRVHPLPEGSDVYWELKVTRDGGRIWKSLTFHSPEELMEVITQIQISLYLPPYEERMGR